MKVTALVSFIILSTVVIAQVPPGYYDTAGGLTGDPLKQALHDIIDGHNAQTYSSLWIHFQTSDDHPSGRVWDMYSDNPAGSPPYTYQFGNDQCGQYSGEGDCYNREHSFPKFWFNDANPMYTDLHQLYPTDGYVNNKRGNHPYGQVGAIDWISDNGSKVGSCSFPGYSGTVFEPIDAFKGDLARTYFYMLTRYKDQAPSWASNTDMLNPNGFALWAENMLLQWHLNDPVSTKEQDRNNAVYAVQGNRNPYIDNPQWVQSIWGPTASLQELAKPAFKLINQTISIHDLSLLGETFQLFNLDGRLKIEGTITGTSTEIPFGSEQGLFILRLNGQAIRVSRFIGS